MTAVCKIQGGLHEGEEGPPCSAHAAGTPQTPGQSKATSRVRGLDALRVIDASVMPSVPRANTYLTTVMIAEAMAARLRVDGGAVGDYRGRPACIIHQSASSPG